MRERVCKSEREKRPVRSVTSTQALVTPDDRRRKPTVRVIGEILGPRTLVQLRIYLSLLYAGRCLRILINQKEFHAWMSFFCKSRRHVVTSALLIVFWSWIGECGGVSWHVCLRMLGIQFAGPVLWSGGWVGGWMEG